jgi:hypothetical protein
LLNLTAPFDIFILEAELVGLDIAQYLNRDIANDRLDGFAFPNKLKKNNALGLISFDKRFGFWGRDRRPSRPQTVVLFLSFLWTKFSIFMRK